MKKSCISILLVLCMVMALLPTTAWAADSDFTIDENGVLTKYNGPGGDVEIPSSVISIGSYAFYNCVDLASVTIPSSITSIEEGAFWGCTNLNSVNIPNSVSSIGESAFVRCTSLISVVIPGGVTRIEESTFSECSRLTGVYLPDSITYIGGSAFDNCFDLTNILIPEGVTTIGASAFSGCHGLKSITIPKSVRNIGISAFSNCNNLESINLSCDIASIGFQTFYGCSKLTSVSIPDGVISIDEGAFYECTSLANVILPDSLTSIGFSAFYGCSSLENINIPNSVTDIDGQAFTDCKSLTSINIPNGLTSIKNNVFSGCENLVSITIPDTVSTIGYAAFSSCQKLQHIDIPDGVTSIGGLAFNFCTNIVSISLPEKIEYLGADIFRNCTNLKNVDLPGDLPYIASGMFEKCSSLTEIHIPNSVTSIGGEAFLNCIHLSKVNIPDNVTSIGNGTFSGCSSLRYVCLPTSLQSIGERAFADNEFAESGLTDVYYSGNETQWNAISINSYDNSKLKSATMHYNSTGPDAPAPDIPTDNYIAVYFLSDWDNTTRTVKFGGNEPVPDTYTVADSVDISGIDSLLNKYVLVTMEQGGSSLEYTITGIQPVESKIGTVSATGEHSLTIDGTNYPVREDCPVAVSVGEEILYHTSNGIIVAYSEVNVTHGEVQAWNNTTGVLTIDGVDYATNFLTDLSFRSDIDNRLNLQYYFKTVTTGDYTVLMEIGSPYYPGGKLEDFNADIYHAKWLSKHGNAADILDNDTPSEILMDVVSKNPSGMAIDMWRSFELVFDTLDDVTTLHDFAVGPKDVYSALILNALEASVSYDIVASEYEDSLKTFRECLSAFSTFMKTDKGIDLNNNAEFQDIVSLMPGVDVDAYTEKFISDWYKENYPNASDISKSLKYISKGLKVVGTLEDFAEYCAACETLMNVSDSMKAVLERACLESAEVYGPLDNMTLAFDDCLKMITRSSDEMFAQIEREAVSVVGMAGMKYLISDVLWGKVTEQVQASCPEVAVLQLGYKVGKTVSNWLCNTDDAAEKYLKMNYITDIESMVDVIYRDLEFDFDKNSTLELAQAYLSAMEFSFRLRDVDCDTAHSYVDNIQSSALGELNELLWGKDYEGLKQSIKNLQGEYSVHFTLAQTDWIGTLGDDYPGSGLYEFFESLYQAVPNIKLIKQITAACPVDVYVYDKSGNVVASVVDNRVSCSGDNLMIALTGEEKTIRFYEGADYRIEYVGYDTGDMDVTITEYDQAEDTVRTVNYYDVALADGQTYSLDIDDTTMKPYTLADKTNSAAIEHDYDSMDKNTAHSITVISGTMLQNKEIYSESTAQKGEKIELNAYVPEGYEFVCWKSSVANVLIADTTNVNTTLVMLDADLTVTAVMRETQHPAKTYTVTFNPNGGAVNVGIATTGLDGKLSILPTPNLNGYTFDGWYTATSGDEKITTDYVFTSDATVYAHWIKNGGGSPGSNPSGGNSSNNGSSSGGSSDTSYSITVGNFAHGSVSISPKSASKGMKVTLTVQPDHGYKLDSLVVKDAKGNTLKLVEETGTKYTFTMPGSKVNIDATFVEIEQQPSSKINFTDVSPDAYYYDAVVWAVEQGITAGTTATTFSPNASCTRAQMVTFLWRAAGSPSPQTSNHPFTDITPGAYYYDAVLWAAEQGITAGTSTNTFSPDATVTRGQTVTFLYRAAGSPAVSGTNSFSDMESSACYAPAVQWAVEKGITAGTSAATFSPNSDCTRGQIVTFLYRNWASQ